jgi:hypothetical protein
VHCWLPLELRSSKFDELGNVNMNLLTIVSKELPNTVEHHLYNDSWY